MRRVLHAVVAFGCGVIPVTAAGAIEVGPARAFHGKSVGPREPMRTGETRGLAAVRALAPARVAETGRLAELSARFARGERPVQEGFTRRLAEPLVVTGAAPAWRGGSVGPAGVLWAQGRDGGQALMVRVDVEEAYATRLHLADVRLPVEVRMWVYGPDQPAVPFGLAMQRPGGDIWSPTVGGAAVWLEVELPATAAPGGDWGFTIDAVGELFTPEVLAKGPAGVAAPDDDDPDYSCLRDASCEDMADYDLEGYESAVAHLRFAKDDGLYICSGALVNDLDDSGFIPYLLTANHCFSTQDSAATLDAFFDYRTPECNGPEPSRWQFPRADGATLLATGEDSDFTFVRLAETPAGERWYLGWSTADVLNGTVLHRLSHPGGKPQAYSRATAATSGTYFCGAVPRSRYLYSLHTVGGTWGGSSGAPLVREGGYIVGQLYGRCGPTAGWEDCDQTVPTVDGAFRTTYPHIAEWLEPGEAPSCVEPIELGQTVGGTWNEECESTHRAGRYARYYTFELDDSTQVQTDLVSAEDPYLYLLSGAGTDGAVIESDDDGGDGISSRITRTLAAGGYTVEATTYAAAAAGSFTVSLTEVSEVSYPNSVWVPVVASTPGVGGSQWSSDVVLTNLSTQLVDLELRFRTTGGTRTWTGRLGPRAAKVIRDVVGELGGSGSGSLEVASEGEVVVDSRTYNTSAAGTFGQYLPGLEPTEMLDAGATAWLTMLEQSALYRTNLGFANAGSGAATLDVTLYDGNGAQVGELTLSIPAGLQVLETQPFLDFGRDNVAGGRALVVVTSGEDVMAHASVIDQRTGDATTVMPR